MSDPLAQHARQARSFDRGAKEYQRARPGYPAAAVAWLLPERGSRVLDLGAGTGKLTAALAALDLDVVAVEPSDAMRTELVAAVAGVRALPGTAESIPLPDADRDGVIVAQAWHWFDQARALREIARVLRPGGRLGIVWNVRDASEPWVEQFDAIVGRADCLPPTFPVPVLDEAFVELEGITIEWTRVIAPAELRTLAASRSSALTLSPAAREELLDEVDRLVMTHPGLAGRVSVDLPYRTTCWRARRV